MIDINTGVHNSYDNVLSLMTGPMGHISTRRWNRV